MKGTLRRLVFLIAFLTLGLTMAFADSPVDSLALHRFAFEWEADGSPAGSEKSSHVVQPYVVEFLDQPVEIPDLSAARVLLNDHGVALSDEELAWSPEQTHLVLATLGDVPGSAGRPAGPRSKWLLARGPVADGIEITDEGGGLVVRIEADLFANAAPRAVRIEGRGGRLHSRRLHHALVRYVTRGGAPTNAPSNSS